MSKGAVQAEGYDSGLPKILQKTGIDQHLDQQVTMSLPVRDENGKTVPLGSFFGKRPAILVMAYYQCPMLCTQVMNGVLGTIKALPFTAGKDFDVISVSIDPTEGAELARKKKAAYMVGYHQQEYAAGYHFLTAEASTIEQLSKEVGFRYAYDSSIKQYAHAAGIMILTPDGKISRYLYGIEYAPINMKFALMDASARKIGSVVDQVLLYCYHYDPKNGKYGAVVMNMLRLGGGTMLILMGVLFLYMYRRNKYKAQLQLGNLA
jgi:protein SCO1/2